MVEKRIKQLGLSRNGHAVQYSAIEDVQAAIEVYKFIGANIRVNMCSKYPLSKQGLTSSGIYVEVKKVVTCFCLSIGAALGVS